MNAKFFTGLLFLSAVAVAPAQNERPRALPSEALERYDDPPAYIWRTDVSPRRISQHDTFTSFQVNVNANGQNITGDAANEPSISVDPTNPNKMAVGWRQFDSVQSNFRQSGRGFTTNGGMTWTFPGVLESNVFRSDPVLAADETGRHFYLSLLESFFDDMWRSDNGGASYMRLASATGGDKQWLTIDNNPASTGHGFQYQAWSTGGNNYGGRQFSRSTDGGLTWLNPIFIPNSPAWGTLEVDLSGTLYIGGVNLNTNQAWCVRSTNAKNGAVTPTFDQSTAVNMGGIVAFSDTINPAGLAGQVFLAVDRSGTATNNNVYMQASLRPTGFSTGVDVMFVRSTNGGQTFSAPKRVNDDPINHSKWHWQSTFAVAPNGRIDSVWLDTRNAANNTDSQLFYSYSFDGGVTWAPNVAVSSSFNPFIGYPNQNKMGDYMGLVSDNTGGSVAYCATFNNEEDIFYVRVAPMSPVVQSAVSRKTHGAAGVFDIPLPLTGTPGIECRTGAVAGAHQVVVTFARPVTLTGAAVTSGSGAAAFSVSGATVTIDLTNVTNAQTLTVTLNSVNDGVNFGNIAIPIGILAGDTTANGTVNTSDVGQTKAESGVPVASANFRADVATNGAINAGDVSLVKANVGNSLP